MIRSMTGFGTASRQGERTRFTVEVRSLNNRYLKAQVRLPEEFQGLEAELESALSKRLHRGSIVVTVGFADLSADAAARLNPAVIERYLDQLLSIDAVRHGAIRIDLAGLLELPGVVITDPDEARLDRARAALFPLLDEAVNELIAMRDREGAALCEHLRTHIATVFEHLAVVESRVPDIILLYEERLKQRMTALLAKSGAAVREEDVLREVAVFAERSDIAEEVARLHGHLEQFATILDDDTDAPSGRTLDFIAQEMLREANTIGSKCLDVEVSKRIVEIKGAIDRIKEQVQNVE